MSSTDKAQAPQALIEAMKYLDSINLLPATSGNGSLLIKEEGTVYITPSGRKKSLLKPEDLAALDITGNILSGRPSSEYRLHLAVYREIPEANYVIHSHAKYALVLAQKGIEVALDEYPEGYELFHGEKVAYLPPIQAGTEELARAVASKLSEGYRLVVIRKHGMVVWDENDPMRAAYRLEVFERLSEISFLMRCI